MANKNSSEGVHILVKAPLARNLRKFAQDRGMSSTAVAAMAICDFVEKRA